LKYMKAMIEAVELETESVVLTSSCDADCSEDDEFPCPYEI